MKHALIPDEDIEKYIKQFMDNDYLFSDRIYLNQAYLLQIKITKVGHIERILRIAKPMHGDVSKIYVIEIEFFSFSLFS